MLKGRMIENIDPETTAMIKQIQKLTIILLIG